MTRFINYLNESKKMSGISFVDIDETIANTFAKILIKDKKTGKVIKELNNQEFNSYELKPNEEFDFQQFRSAEFFKKTSKPIVPIINRIKKMINKIKKYGKESKVIFLTARSDFDDKKKFLSWFKEHGIDVDFKSNVYIERAGKLKTGTVPEKKERIILKYLKEGKYRRVRIIDDYTGNLKTFLNLKNKISHDIIEKTRKNAGISEDNNKPVIELFALLAKPNGKLELYGKEEIY